MSSLYRIHPQPSFNFGGLVIDNFAGGGGASTGIEMALGRPVDIAINHDPEAIAMHEINHPHTKHYCESVWEVDPRKITGGRPVDLCWFSPDCKHFSKAKGGKPVRKEIRGLAWVAIRYAATVRPRVIMLENVEEFVTWGPLADGRPCPKNKGRTFNSFVNALRRHGYQVEWRELRANQYGAATIRKRLFLIARCDGQPIVWPSPSHLAASSAEVKAKQAQPQHLAADIIDWSLPCPSIFNRKRPLAEATMRRIARGIQRYVIESAEPFIVSYYGTKNGKDLRSLSVDQPLRTQTTENRFAVVAPVITKFRTNDRGTSVEEPLPTVTANSYIKRPGGAAPIGLVAAFLAKHYGGNYKGPGAPMTDPAPTVTTVDHNALVTSHLLKLRNNCDGQDMREPMHTLTTGGHFGEVRAFLLKYYEHGCGQSLDDPLHTITTKDRLGLVMVKGEPYQIVDIGMRMLEPHELYAAQGFPADYIHDRTLTNPKLSKSSQVRMCGNSVCPPVAAALVRANLVEQQQSEVAA
ncbi:MULTISPECIES: DNA cytosine methyltransferase [unclassified Pseudomonas]|uniref:DNA cytosine methyltransferase n=1 Tax=unclassified Pseudomonas TaxID=196821 RepID=UPI002448BAF9|nr:MULTISPECIES: DNA cytosine methyltransferase [unclassified Pseudomonas]MDG9926152.1 DNA cytosine methyltransferase [Pseudomonas sp. GD04045]MDH0037496.1 DNA cytosine methyltransferase [Pseudomonas sp. GD04019]